MKQVCHLLAAQSSGWGVKISQACKTPTEKFESFRKTDCQQMASLLFDESQKCLSAHVFVLFSGATVRKCVLKMHSAEKQSRPLIPYLPALTLPLPLSV